MAPTLRPRGHNGRHRSSQTQSERGISSLSVHSDTEINNNFKDYRKHNHPNVPQKFKPSVHPRKIQTTHSEECAKKVAQVFPGGFPGYSEPSGQGESFRDDQRLESIGIECESLLKKNRNPHIPHCPSMSQLQPEKQALTQTSQECSEEQSLEELQLRGNDKNF